MDTELIVAIAVIAAVVILALGAFMVIRSRKRKSLKERYGPEYERSVKERGRRKGEQELSEREKRIAELNIRELNPEERREFSNRWIGVQAKFVDAPRTALQHADVLVQEVMGHRGYPVKDFEQRVADLSVDHAEFVSDYRAAHEISQRAETATTEEMRQAMIHYRSLFSHLLGAEASVSA